MSGNSNGGGGNGDGVERRAEHAPGPWTAEGTAGWRGLRDGNGETLATLCFSGYRTERECNASLAVIEAAPDLLAALRVMVGWESSAQYETNAIRELVREHAEDDISVVVLSIARAAIAKAEGGRA